MPIGRKSLILYSTPACHLCETALGLVEPLISSMAIVITKVDISNSDELVELYGIRIPVFCFENKDFEIGWPFTEQEFREFLAEGLDG